MLSAAGFFFFLRGSGTKEEPLYDSSIITFYDIESRSIATAAFLAPILPRGIV